MCDDMIKLSQKLKMMFAQAKEMLDAQFGIKDEHCDDFHSILDDISESIGMRQGKIKRVNELQIGATVRVCGLQSDSGRLINGAQGIIVESSSLRQDIVFVLRMVISKR